MTRMTHWNNTHQAEAERLTWSMRGGDLALSTVKQRAVKI